MCGHSLEPHENVCPNCGEGTGHKAAIAERVWRAFRRNISTLAVYWMVSGSVAMLISLGIASAVLTRSGAPALEIKILAGFLFAMQLVFGLGLVVSGIQLLKRRSNSISFGLWMNYGLITACVPILNLLTLVIALPVLLKARATRRDIDRIKSYGISPDMSLEELRHELVGDPAAADLIDRSQFD